MRLGGQAVPEARIHLENREAHGRRIELKADNAGWFTAHGLEDGEWRLMVSTVVDETSYSFRTSFFVEDASLVRRDVFIAEPSAALEGYVRNEPEYDGRVEVSVRIEYPEGDRYITQTIAGEDGYYRLDYLPVGRLQVQVRIRLERESERSSVADVELLEGQVVSQDFDFSARMGVRGIVTSSSGRQYVQIYAMRGDLKESLKERIYSSEMLDSDHVTLYSVGTYTINVDEPGTYTILTTNLDEATIDSVESRSRVVMIGEGEMVELDLEF